jgi:hypothetical protein
MLQERMADSRGERWREEKSREEKSRAEQSSLKHP